MPILRLTQHQESDNNYRVEIAFEDDDRSRLTADVYSPFGLTRMERADLRNFESYGGRAKEDEERTKELIAEIERLIKEQK